MQSGYSAQAPNEPSIKIGKSQEALQLFDGGGLWPVANGLGLGRARLDMTLGDEETQEQNGVDIKLPLLRCHKQSFL